MSWGRARIQILWNCVLRAKVILYSLCLLRVIVMAWEREKQKLWWRKSVSTVWWWCLPGICCFCRHWMRKLSISFWCLLWHEMNMSCTSHDINLWPKSSHSTAHFSNTLCQVHCAAAFKRAIVYFRVCPKQNKYYSYMVLASLNMSHKSRKP